MKHLQKAVCALLAALLLSGCGEGRRADDCAEAAGVAQAVAESQGGSGEGLTALRRGEAGFSEYLRAYYAIPEETVTDGTILLAGGVEATEIAVLRLSDGEAAREAVSLLEAYCAARAGDFTGYAPEQEAMVSDGMAVRRESWAALLICPRPDAAERAFRAALNAHATAPPETPRPEPSAEPAPRPTAAPTPSPAPEITQTPAPADDDPYSTGPEYDHDAVLAAWRSGDPSALSEKNRAIYDAAAAVIGSELTEGMDDYEKELAVHDWMIANAQYDPGELNHLFAGPAPEADNNNPYGLMLRGKGICVGYSSTFQLFMDMLDIECVTVYGMANEGGPGDEHAWNMVRLDGEWYCVDVTWDDPVGGLHVSAAEHHRYFNVTSDFLRGHAHYWDETTVPEATATQWRWQEQAV